MKQLLHWLLVNCFKADNIIETVSELQEKTQTCVYAFMGSVIYIHIILIAVNNEITVHTCSVQPPQHHNFNQYRGSGDKMRKWD